MSLDTEKQFAGNYVRLVNQCRDLQADIVVKDKMIELISNFVGDNGEYIDIDYFKTKAVEQLVAEQNKKAAEGSL